MLSPELHNPEPEAAATPDPRQGRSIRIEGLVQGVGFRPFVFVLATRLGLVGRVRNETGTVAIEVEGPANSIERFVAALEQEAPPLARIEKIEGRTAPLRGFEGFDIAPSEAAGGQAVSIPPDVATCEACLAELRAPGDRRYRYPFLNCTQCGPRLTIIRAVPYDRAQTTMAGFAMCAPCTREYTDPRDRRFHAQPTACAECGPSLGYRDAEGRAVPGEAALAAAAEALVRGRVVAIKGLGGYHLAVDAADTGAVTALRTRKGREEKPFAVMVADLEAASRLAEVPAIAREALLSPARPIVLLRKKPGLPIAEGVAPGSLDLGIMLPYTPLHHLLLEAVGGMPLVMTSGNLTDEPIAYRDDEALARLGTIADGFLLHDRPIHQRADDSVMRFAADRPILIRRSRGLAPAPIRLPRPTSQPTLALGGQIKGTFALGEADRAVLSHHLGDLDDFATYQDYQSAIAHYSDLFGITPTRLVHDLHPAYASTTLAIQWARERGLARLPVQHHHAHMASCLAEHGHDQPVIGVIFDGTGYGTDGTVWGGEFLVGDCAGFRRAGHLRTVRMPGGEAAIREPWRMAAAHGLAAGLERPALASRIGETAWQTVLKMAERGLQSPETSSMGRLFDAVAALVGLGDRARYEGQAAMALEAIATGEPPDRAYAYEAAEAEGVLVFDPRPLIREVGADLDSGVPAAVIARRFHSTVVAMIAGGCRHLRETTGLDTVALSGGVFMNALVLHEAAERLERAGFRVLTHRGVPPNDGGLALGQLAVAAAQDARKEA